MLLWERDRERRREGGREGGLGRERGVERERVQALLRELKLLRKRVRERAHGPTRRDTSRAITRPIGHRLLVIAEFLYSRKTYEEVFESAILDARADYNDYLSKGRKWKARWTALQTYVLVGELAFKHGLGKVFDFAKQVVTGISMGG